MGYKTGAKRKLTAQLALEGGVEASTLTGNLTLDDKSANFLRLDPGGSSRDVTLPAEGTNNGLIFWLLNAADAAENLVVKDDGGSTIVTLAQYEGAIVGCDGTTWRVHGFFSEDVLGVLAGTGGAALVGDGDAGGFFTGSTVAAQLQEIGPFVPVEITDPGDAGAVPITQSGVCHLVTAGAETRTVADPTMVGQELTLYFLTDAGDCVVTFQSAVNQAGNNTLTLANAGDAAHFRSARDGAGAYHWHVVGSDLGAGAAFSTV